MIVIKRDGTEGFYNKVKIRAAIKKASKQIVKINKKELIGLVDKCDLQMKKSKKEKYSVYEIQNVVEDVLMDFNHDVARSYIEYRNKRDIMRESESLLTKSIMGLMNKTDDNLLNENANKDGNIIPTQRDLLAGIIAKHYALHNLMYKNVATSHMSGDLHFHDLDYSPFFPMFNCMLISLGFMLSKGFKLGNAQIETPRSIGTACSVTAQIIAQVSSHIYGGNTINGIDIILAKYVKASHDKNIKAEKRRSDLLEKEGHPKVANKFIEQFAMEKTEKDTYDAFQCLEYEINTLHCANGQTPFTTLGFGMGVSWEERLIQKAILQVRIDGLGKEKHTAIFPKLVFGIKKGLNFEKGDPNYDIKIKALECSSKRMYPDILNYHKNVEITGSFKYPMGCRSFLGKYIDENNKEFYDGRNNIGVVTLNLPRIAIESKQNKKEFFRILDIKLKLAYEALWVRINSLKGVKANVAPILYMEGALGVKMKADDCVFNLFKNGRASISLGYIGMNEVAISMFGDKPHIFESNEKKEFILSIFKVLNDRVNKWTADTGYAFGLYGTPSESLCDRFCGLDQRKFGTIKGVNDKGYYTNSFHLDVEKEVNVYEKMDFESSFVGLSSGGHICYGEFPNMKNNIKALERVWDYSYEKVPYYGTNTASDSCHKCKFIGEFKCTSKGYVCGKCGNHDQKEMNVIRRVCGYLGEPNLRPFIKGKSEELKRRVKHA